MTHNRMPGLTTYFLARVDPPPPGTHARNHAIYADECGQEIKLVCYVPDWIADHFRSMPSDDLSIMLHWIGKCQIGAEATGRIYGRDAVRKEFRAMLGLE